MKSYGQYCPVARASEVLSERWTMILVRNLLAGCTTFGELRDGAPGIPRALLSSRLDTLVAAGVVVRRPRARGRGWTYQLTAKGQALEAVCHAMGEWGSSWLEPAPHHLEPGYAVWATTRLVDLRRVPEPGVTVRVDLEHDGRTQRFWMLLFEPRAEVCTRPMGRTEDLVVSTDARTLIEWNLRRVSFPAVLRSGRLRLEGPRHLTRGFPSWTRPSPWADVERPDGPPTSGPRAAAG